MKRQICKEVFDQVADDEEPKETNGRLQSRFVFSSWRKTSHTEESGVGEGSPEAGDSELQGSNAMMSLSHEGLCEAITMEDEDSPPQFSFYRPHSSTGIANLDELNGLDNDGPLPPPMEILCSPLRRLPIPSTSLKDCHNLPPEDVASTRDVKTSPLVTLSYSYNALKEASGGCRDSGMSCAFSSSTSLTSSETILIPPPLTNNETADIVSPRSAPPIPPHRRTGQPHHYHQHRSAERAPMGTRSVKVPCHPPARHHMVTQLNTSSEQLRPSQYPAPSNPIGASPLDSGVDDISPGEYSLANHVDHIQVTKCQQLASYESGIPPPHTTCHCHTSMPQQCQQRPPAHRHHSPQSPNKQTLVNISHNYPYGIVISSSSSVFPSYSCSVAHSEPTLVNCAVGHHACCSSDACSQLTKQNSPVLNFVASTECHPLTVHPSSRQHLSNQSVDFQSPIWKRKTPERSTAPNPHMSSNNNSADKQRPPAPQKIYDPCNKSCQVILSSNRNPAQSDSVPSHHPRSSHHATREVDNRRDKTYRKRMYRMGLNLFNIKPWEGMQWLLRHQFLSESPKAVALFLHTRKGINRQKLGEYLGDKRNELVLEAYCFLMDFRGLIVDEAVRKMNHQFLLNGESDCILRITENFAKAYWHQNEVWLKEQLGIDTLDSVLLLAYSILMLNTDLNSGKLKPGSRMKLKEFSKNLKGLNNGHDFDSKLLNTIYLRIQERPFTVRDDHTTQVVQISETLSPPDSLSSPPHRRLVCICKMQECVLVDGVSSSSGARSDQLPHLHNGFLQVQQQQRYVFLFNDFIIVACRIPSQATSTENKSSKLLNTSQRDHQMSSHSGSSAPLLSCIGATSSTLKSKPLPNPPASGKNASFDIISRMKHYRVIHCGKLVEMKAHLLYRNITEQLFAVQLCAAATNANLFILRAMSESDFVHFLDDLKECIWESNEMEALRRLTDSSQSHSQASD